jgi:hypothetical protein
VDGGAIGALLGKAPVASDRLCTRTVRARQSMSGFWAVSQSYPSAREQDESRRVARNQNRSGGESGREKSRSVYNEMGPDGATEPSNSLSEMGCSKG